MTNEEVEKLVEELFSTGTKIIHPAFPAHLKAGERVEFEHRPDGWYWSTLIEEKGPFTSLSQARHDRTKSAEQNLEAERKGINES